MLPEVEIVVPLGGRREDAVEDAHLERTDGICAGLRSHGSVDLAEGASAGGGEARPPA